MLDLDALTARRQLIDESPDLAALRDRLVERAAPVLARMPIVPPTKALLSRDGGICPDDRSPLVFDPWSPDDHRCPVCSRTFGSPHHHAHWARTQHLWVAERAAHLATICAMTGDQRAGARAREILAEYYTLYFDLPNRDNVLGPTHLFFSTYLESIWLLDYLSAAFILRELGVLDDSDIDQINAIADEAATIIAEFNEGLSNRQTWNSAALAAIAVWFGDEELALTAIEGRTGLLGHLGDGFGRDGMWFEGENYHLFAMRGLLVGLQWATVAGATLLDDDAVARHLAEAMMAPADTALPDLTFPARKDSRYGVSLAHPAYIESWEAGFAALGERAPAGLASWIAALYAVPPHEEATYDSYLHEAGEPKPHRRARSELSWWALLTMAPELPAADEPWRGRTVFLDQQGLAVIRHGETYVSLECGGRSGGGHGHPDRLHLTVHVGGVHWLPDPGAGSYVTPDLFWYRSTMAHNAPIEDGHDQRRLDSARCEAFAVNGDWAWCAATWTDARRRIVVGPEWMVDLFIFESAVPHRLELPWHLHGEYRLDAPMESIAEPSPNSFLSEMESCNLSDNPGGAIEVTATAGERTMRLRFAGDGELLRTRGPGLPGEQSLQPMLIRRHDGEQAAMATVLDFTGIVTAMDVAASTVRVHHGDVITTIEFGTTDVAITSAGRRIALGGARPPALGRATFVLDRPTPSRASAIWIDAAPALDGSLTGFSRRSPLALDDEHQYYRTELAYPGPDAFSATACLNWSDHELYLAVDVIKDDLIIRADDAPPLGLDNEPDDINTDSLQLYSNLPGHHIDGWLIRPHIDGRIIVRPIGAVSREAPSGRWSRTDRGYCVTLRVPTPGLADLLRHDRVGFDLIVNEMRSGRIRRAGQLIWTGGAGWAYLRGDRHDPAQLGEVELT
ncbi:MAG TPA: heparinase II/III family protein [Gemmatimonadales bacterium]|jgi:hypothetical protein